MDPSSETIALSPKTIDLSRETIDPSPETIDLVYRDDRSLSEEPGSPSERKYLRSAS